MTDVDPERVDGDEGDRSPITFPPELPISARVADIAQAIDQHQVVIVAGATGSGKTTQLPKIALAMGRGLEKVIGVTQPRRIAATSVATRVAEELGSPLGTDVGYQIRFDDRTSPRTYVKFMTDGILLAEIQGDPLLRRYDTIIVDEAHERSLTIDFLLGWLRRILPQRPDLKVIVSSATLETERFAAFFAGRSGPAPVISVEGRTYPVEVLYEPPEDDVDIATAVGDAVANVASLDPDGDILVFLPGEREIRESENEIVARKLKHTVVLPLYARLSASDQNRVFTRISERRVVLATNVAETSITIPGIVYVVDTGVARLSRYDPRSGTTRLQIEGISQASADQRKGRCGRVREGICVRLYDEASFAARVGFTDPEIKRTGLAGVILRMKALGLGAVEEFPFLDPPQSRSITEGYRVLEELGALGDKRELTPLGERLARFPVDPRIGRMILAGADLGCLPEVLVVAAALNVQDPRERPREHQQKADDLHRRFKDDASDFVGLLKMWRFVRDAEREGRGKLRRVCKDNFLSFMRIREWTEIHRQLTEIVGDLEREARGRAERGARERGEPRRDEREGSRRDGRTSDGPRDGRRGLPEAHAGEVKTGTKGESDPKLDALHQALLTGLLSRIGKYNAEQRIYMGAKQTRFALHPSSGLAKRSPFWVMAFELVETSQLFARMAARIDPEWLEVAAPHLLKRSYADPHWSERSARAVVKENVTLFGLTVARDKTVDYTRVAPIEARRIFIDHALVRGEYKTRDPFQQANQKLLEEVARIRDKARRSDMLADDEALIAFFDRVVPEDVVDGKTFEAWREATAKAKPDPLLLAIGDVLVGEPHLSPANFPDVITLHGVKLPLGYKFDPSADDDGITVTIPLVLLPQIEPGELDWMIPGHHEEKLRALLYELPRAARKDAGDVPEVAKRLATKLRPFDGPLIPALARETGIDEDAFRPDAVATYLRFVVRVVAEDGKVLAQGRDVDAILERFGSKARAVWEKKAPAPRFERTGITSFDFARLEPFVTRKVSGTEVRSYPALVDRGTSVDLVLLESAAAAATATRAGVRRLFMIASRQTLSAITPRLPPPFARPNGSLPSRADADAFRAMLASRIVDAAFDLEGDAPVPTDQASFEARLGASRARIEPAARLFMTAVTTASAALDKVLAAIRAASKHPSGRLAIVDIQAQLEALFPPDLMQTVALSRLEQFPRYLRAAEVRLGRAVTDPRKDADKAAPIAPLWKDFVTKAPRARDPVAAVATRWLFEELRVAIFAPELRTPVPVSTSKVAAAVAALR